MLDQCNPLVKQFRIARDRLLGYEDECLAIRIDALTDGDSPQFS